VALCTSDVILNTVYLNVAHHLPLGIGSFFKPIGIPSSVKSGITEKCVEFVCKDIRPFETVSGDGFIALAQAFVNVGVRYGQISASDVLPHPTTVSKG